MYIRNKENQYTKQNEYLYRIIDKELYCLPPTSAHKLLTEYCRKRHTEKNIEPLHTEYLVGYEISDRLNTVHAVNDGGNAYR